MRATRGADGWARLGRKPGGIREHFSFYGTIQAAKYTGEGTRGNFPGKIAKFTGSDCGWQRNEQPHSGRDNHQLADKTGGGCKWSSLFEGHEARTNGRKSVSSCPVGRPYAGNGWIRSCGASEERSATSARDRNSTHLCRGAR